MPIYVNIDVDAISERDINGVLNYLSIFDPDHATRERVIEFLDFYTTVVHRRGNKISDSEFVEIYKGFAKAKSKKLQTHK